MPEVIAPANPSATRAAQWREYAGPARHDQRRQGDACTREVPVSRQQPVDGRHVQRVARRIVQRRGRRTRPSDRSSATAPIIPPCSSVQDRGPTPIEFLLHGLAACITAGIGNIAAARGVTLDVGRVARRGRHRSAGHPGAVRRGPQRLRAHPHQLHDRRRCAAGEAARDRRAIPRALGGVRCAHQRCAG